VDVAFDPARDDFAFGVVPFGVHEIREEISSGCCIIWPSMAMESASAWQGAGSVQSSSAPSCSSAGATGW
jgi:hypothetical protein